MKNKKLRNKIVAIIAAMVLIVLAAIPALASVGENTYTPINGTSGAGFDKYLIIEENDVIPPNAVFNFEVSAPTSDIDAANDSLQVFKGPDSDKVKLYVAGEEAVKISSGTYSISFSGATANTNYGDSGAATLDGFVSGTKYAKKSVVVDFSDVSFTKPGVYRYYITENETTGFGRIHGDKKTIDVFVSDTDPSGTSSGTVTSSGTAYGLKIDGYVMYNGKVEEAPGKSASGSLPSGTVKDTVVVNKYPSVDLLITKKVAGNQASKSEFFSFTLEISHGTPNAKLTVETSKMVVNGDHNNSLNVASPSITLDENGAGSLTFELQHGQSIRIYGLAEKSFYSVVEDNGEKLNKDGYTTVITQTVTDTSEKGAIDDDARTIVLNSGTGSGTGMTKANEITFTNTKEGKIPTGVNMKVVPIVVVALLFIGGISVLTVRMAKKEENEE